jgi:hypothetical protein
MIVLARKIKITISEEVTTAWRINDIDVTRCILWILYSYFSSRFLFLMIVLYLESLLRLLSWKKFVNILLKQLLLILTLTNRFLPHPQILWVDTQCKLTVRHINDQLLRIGLEFVCLMNWLTHALTYYDDRIERRPIYR